MVKVTIDGITVEVPENATILQAAMKAGVDIPYFCYHPYLKPAGLCRMCLVEVEGMPKLAPACVTQVRDGMVVRTNTERVKKVREGIVEFQLLHHPLDCPICDQAGECYLQDITFRYGRATSRFVDEKELYPTKFYGPLIVHEQSRCILCKRCVRFCTEVLNGADWNVYWRAAHSLIGSYESDKVANYFTCNLVEVCPVGAITSRLYRYKTRIWKLEFTRSVCEHCEMGCSLDLGVRENQLFKIKHRMADPSPWICDKGYYAFDYVNHAERILYPLARQENKMVSVEVEDAVSSIADKLKNYGEGEVAFILSPSLCLEDAAAVSSMAKAVKGLVDYRVYGEDYLPVKGNVSDIEDVESAKAVLVVGGDVAVSHPVLALSILKAKNAGAKVGVLSAHDIFLGERVDVFSLLPAGSEEPLIKELLDGNVDAIPDLSDEERSCLKDMLSGELLLVAGVRASSALRAAIYSRSKEKGWKYLFLDRGCNAKGLYSAGAYSEGVGEILNRVKEGKVKALVVAGVDLFNTYPNGSLVKEALESAEFLVVMDLFFHDTAMYSDFFLPITSFAEDGGSVVDLFWRVRRRNPAMQPKGLSRPVRDWLALIGEAMGADVDSQGQVAETGWDPLQAKAELLEVKGNTVALVEHTFYRSARYASWCSRFSEVAESPCAYISEDDAKALGVSDGDKVLVSGKGGKFEFVAKVREGQPKGSIVIDAGFDRFPVTLLLNGSWVAPVELRKA